MDYNLAGDKYDKYWSSMSAKDIESILYHIKVNKFLKKINNLRK